MKQFLLAALLLWQAPVRTQIVPGAIAGRLLSLDGTPASNTRIAAMPWTEDKASAPVLESIVQTGKDGSYRLEGIVPGKYYVFAGLIDLPSYHPGVSSLERATIITVEPGMTVSDVNFTLARPAGMKVTGRIMGPASIGNSGVKLTALGRVGGVARDATVEAVDGVFDFDGILPGNYRLALTSRGSSTISVSVTDKDIRDIQLAAVDCSAGLEVQGRLIGVPSVAVTTVSVSGTEFGCSRSVEVGIDGRFVIPNLPDDTYALQLTPEPLGWEKSSLVVANRSVTGQNIELPETIEIKGRLTLEDGGAIPKLLRGTSIVVQFRGDYRSFTANFQDDGTFALRLLPGSYEVSVPGLPKIYYIKSLMYGRDNLEIERLELDGKRSDEIVIKTGLENRDRGVTVSGRVIPAPSGALRKPEGVLLASSFGGRNDPSVLTALDENGRFEFRGVIPGQYDLQTSPDSPIMLTGIRIYRSDLKGLQLQMPILFKLNGTMDWIDETAGSKPPAPPDISIQFTRRTRARSDDKSVSTWATLVRNGALQVYLPEGEYKLSVTGLPANARLASVMLGTQALSDGLLRIDSTFSSTDLKINLQKR
jgi:hypothetical protein